MTGTLLDPLSRRGSTRSPGTPPAVRFGRSGTSGHPERPAEDPGVGSASGAVPRHLDGVLAGCPVLDDAPGRGSPAEGADRVHGGDLGRGDGESVDDEIDRVARREIDLD